MKTIYLDIMKKGRFYRQLEYKWCTLWPIDLNEIREYVESKCKSLKAGQYTIEFSEQPMYV